MMAIKEINSGSNFYFPWLSLVRNILAMKTFCGVRYFSFIPRATNKLADRIATTHSLQDSFSLWW